MISAFRKPMNRIHFPTLTKILLIFFIVILIQGFITGFTSLPIEGDSIAYHIPIAKNLWNGGLLNPQGILHFYPSIGEAILSVFMMLHIPLNLFNILAIGLLFLGAQRLGREYGLSKDMAIVFAVALCTMQLTTRWMFTQVVDIWVAVFFIYSLMLLHRPSKSLTYYVSLGITMGLLIGTKNSAPVFALILLIFYRQNFTKHLTLKRFLSFLLLVVVLGCFWYIRNSVIMGNPLYPQAVLSYKGAPNWNILEWNVGEILVANPFNMFNAFVSEYMIWIFALLVPFVRSKNDGVKTLTQLGYCNLLFFLCLPTTPEYNIMVSSFRYSYPAFIPLILCIFLLCQEYKKERYLGAIVFLNMLVLIVPPYRPKVLFILLPLLWMVWYYADSKFRMKQRHQLLKESDL